MFLGDYVDRGVHSVELVILLMVMKINYPNQVFLLRGNHENRAMTIQYTFYKECINKYDQDIFDRIVNSFHCLPLSCVVNEEIFCTHGGISSKIQYVEDINKINRFVEAPLTGLFCDLLWADPVEDENGVMPESADNVTRGCSVVFGSDIANSFLKRNKLRTIVRSHEVYLPGYKKYYWNGSSELPPLITIFSAPNYCESAGNLGCFIYVDVLDLLFRKGKFQSNSSRRIRSETE